MPKSKGKRSKTRKKLSKNIRERGKISTTKIIKDYPIGSKATIKIDSSLPKGQPHAKFHGKAGIITGKQGNSYIVNIKDGDKDKKVIARPEHLEKVEE